MTRKVVRALATAAAMRSASAMEMASGFWAETCLPAASAATIWSACIHVGVSSSTASTAASSSTCAKSEYSRGVIPHSRARRLARSASVSQSATTSQRGCCR